MTHEASSALWILDGELVSQYSMFSPFLFVHPDPYSDFGIVAEPVYFWPAPARVFFHRLRLRLQLIKKVGFQLLNFLKQHSFFLTRKNSFF